jgi:hypothetical protein
MGREVGAPSVLRRGRRQLNCETIDCYRYKSFAASMPTYPSVSPQYSPHSHSIILSDRNASNSECKFFPHMTKNRLADPSEICALEFKGEFAQFRNWLVSAIIGKRTGPRFYHPNARECGSPS